MYEDIHSSFLILWGSQEIPLGAILYVGTNEILKGFLLA